MKTKIFKMRYAFLAFVGVVLGAAAVTGAVMGVASRAAAQGAPPQLLVTWQADTYVPDGFAGKVMPASDSPITVGVDMIDLGKRVDLGPYKVFWYIDEKFYQGAPGLTRISLSAPHFIGANAITVRVVVTDYGGGPGKTITIPVVVPEAVIQSSAPSLAASAAPFNLRAYPYFFNINNPSELNFAWSLNGAVVSDQNPFVVTGEMAAGRGPARVELSIRNPARPIERITQELSIFR
jgi:hypothetical protein